MNIQNTNPEIKIEFGTLGVDSVSPHAYKNGISSAQLRQVVKTTYPSIRVGNSRTSSLFAQEAFNLESGQAYESTRVTWINVPNGTTVEQVVAQLRNHPGARIYRVISNNVEEVLTDEQKQAVQAGLTTLATFEEKLRVRRTDANGNVVDIEGPAQYRQHFFSTTAKADEDYRTITTPTSESQTEATNQEVVTNQLADVVM